MLLHSICLLPTRILGRIAAMAAYCYKSKVVCLYVCWSHPWALQKWLNRSRCCSEDWHLWATGTFI